MSCEALRTRLAGDPARTDAEFDRHAADCAACEAYRRRLLRAEMLIQQALRFDVAATRRGASERSRPKQPAWLMVGSGIAAGLLVAVAFWGLFGGGAYLSPEALATEVTEHWYHEPGAWVRSDSPVAASVLLDVLDGDVRIDLSELETVSYAQSCWVAGEWIPHLVVQSDSGPYMVLLLPGRALASPVPLELLDEGLSGHILPAGGGSIAVLGSGGPEQVEQVEASLIAAVDWTI